MLQLLPRDLSAAALRLVQAEEEEEAVVEEAEEEAVVEVHQQ